MGKKKNLKGIDEDDLRFINEKMNKKHNYDASDSYVNYNYNIKYKCKTQAQKNFVKLLKSEKSLIVAYGAAGSGKSFISLAWALSMIGQCLPGSDKPIKRIDIFLPTLPAGNSDIQLGFLPGTLQEKLSVFQTADQNTIITILEQSGVTNAKSVAEGLFRNNIITYSPISYVRGRTYNDSIMLINEGQQFNKSELLLLLTRMGENTKVVISGDVRQKDRRAAKADNIISGMEYMMERLSLLDDNEYGCVEFKNEDIVRNKLITKILTYWDMSEFELSQYMKKKLGECEDKEKENAESAEQISSKKSRKSEAWDLSEIEIEKPKKLKRIKNSTEEDLTFNVEELEDANKKEETNSDDGSKKKRGRPKKTVE